MFYSAYNYFCFETFFLADKSKFKGLLAVEEGHGFDLGFSTFVKEPLDLRKEHIMNK